MLNDFQSDVLVLGSGENARQICGELAEQGMTVQLATADDVAVIETDRYLEGLGIKKIPGCRLSACSGHAGAFQVGLDQGGGHISCRAASIVVVGAPNYKPDFESYGIMPSERVFTASDLARKMDGDPSGAIMPGDSRVVFLNGWHHETHPVMAARMLQLCLKVQQNGLGNTFFMTGNLKVSVDGAEACCQAARAAGTVFLKFTERFPHLQTIGDGRVRIDYWDESAHMMFSLPADYVIVDEYIKPDPALIHCADLLRLDRDSFGFVQSDNVHRLGNETNRRGIFVADAARAILSPEERRADAGHLVLKVAAFLSGSDRGPLPKVEIDQGRCARCLTCYRLCPHAAIDIFPRMTIVAAACQSCGICAAGCPNKAIGIDDPVLATAVANLGAQAGETVPDEKFVPRIVAFCCRRSAAPARELALSMGHPLPSGLTIVEGRCGGTFSINHLLSAFEGGVDGIIVLTCHSGNCHSEQGTRNAQIRSVEATNALALASVEKARIQFSTLAANMGSELAQCLNDFERRIQTLGPLGG